MDSEQLQTLTIDALDEIKAVDVVALDVRRLTSIADSIVIASGTSQRHVQSLADNVLQRAREAGIRPLGVEGEQTGDWVLVDLGHRACHAAGSSGFLQSRKALGCRASFRVGRGLSGSGAVASDRRGPASARVGQHGLLRI